MSYPTCRDDTLRSAELAFEQRIECYRRLGHDREAAARWVVDAAGPLASPVLDIGTGKGLLAIELARHGHAVTSIDPCWQDQLLAARRAECAGFAAAISFVAGTIEALEAAVASFGAAAMMDVLHHLDTVEPVMTRISDLVRPGGRLLVAEFSESGFDLVSRAHRSEGRVHERGPVAMGEVRDALLRRGWRVGHEAAGHHHEVVVFVRRA